jgi:methyl coenzyme M reductase alpha subunit
MDLVASDIVNESEDLEYVNNACLIQVRFV